MSGLKCMLCLRRLRQGVSSCKDCQSALWKLECLEQQTLLYQAPASISSIPHFSSLPSMIQRRKIVSPLVTLLSYSTENQLMPSRGGSLHTFSSAMKRSLESTKIFEEDCTANSEEKNDKESPPKVFKPETSEQESAGLADNAESETKVSIEAETMSATKLHRVTSTSKFTFTVLTESENLGTIGETNSQTLPSKLKPSMAAAVLSQLAHQPGQVLGTTAWQVSPIRNLSRPASPLSILQSPIGSLNPQSLCRTPLSDLSALAAPSPTGSFGRLFFSATPSPNITSFRTYHSTQTLDTVTSNALLQHVLFDAVDASEDITKTDAFKLTKREKIISLQRQEYSTLQYSTMQNVQLIQRKSPLPAAVSQTDNELEEGEIREDKMLEGGGELEDFEDYLAENYQDKLKWLPRQWEWTPFGEVYRNKASFKLNPPNGRKPVEFKIMTYNILSQDLLENHDYLYTGGCSRSLDWNNRRRTIIAEIACHNPDILNMQEVHREHFNEYLKPRLQRLGYTGSYVKRSGDKNDGCVTLWKKDKFQLLRATPVNYCRGGLLDRDNIAIVVELHPIRTENEVPSFDDKIVVANTHLLFNPKRGDIKLAQLMVLLAEIDKHAYIGSGSSQQSPGSTAFKDKYCPVILTGDFNMEPQSAMFKFLISGQLDYEGLLTKEISGQAEGASGRNLLLERNFFSSNYGITDYCQYHTAVVDRLNEYLQAEKLKSEVPTSPGSVQLEHAANIVAGASELQACDASILQVGAVLSSNNSLVDTSSTDIQWNFRAPATSSDVGTNLHSADTLSADESGQIPMVVNTGQLWHALNLISAYRHRIERLGFRAHEVTTHHNRADCTVDYIFYNVNSKESENVRGEMRIRNIRDGNLKLLGRYGHMSSDEFRRVGGIPNEVQPSDHVCLMSQFLLL